MKKIIMLVAVISLLSGCTTFGTFANLKQGESSKEKVLSMLGEPQSKRFLDEKEVWHYEFQKKNEAAANAMQTNLNLDVTFENNKIDNYNITVSKEAAQKAQPLPQARKPIQSQGRKEKRFIKKFDQDQDGRVSMDEFSGPDQLFNKLDENSDGYIDSDEVPTPPQQGQGQGRPAPRGRR